MGPEAGSYRMVGEKSTYSRFGLLLAGAGVVIGAVLGISQKPAPVVPGPSVSAPVVAASPALIEVHVAGWVASPGVVQILDGSLTADAIRAAGGFRPGARSDAVNLAAPLSAGQQLVIPGPGAGEDPPGGSGAVSTGGLVAVNRATAADLETLPGVGPVLAARILAYRDQHGPFSQIEDLLAVSGVGEAKLAAIRDLITVP